LERWIASKKIGNKLKIAFVVSGPTALIVASSLAKTLYKLDEVVLIYELATTIPSSQMTKRFEIAEKKLMSHFSCLAKWKMVIPVQCNRTHVNPFKNPIIFIKEGLALKQAVKGVSKMLPWQPDVIAYSSNAAIQRYLYRDTQETYLIEHGIGDYYFENSADPGRKFRLLIKKLVKFFFGVPGSVFPKKFILCDGGKSTTVTKKFHHASPIVRASTPDISSMSEILIKMMAENSDPFLTEIRSINAEKSKYKNAYLYCPAGTVPINEYHLYLAEQLREIDVFDSIFIIKKHQADSASYARIFNEMGIDAIEIKDEMWQFAPVEIIFSLLPGVVPVGAGSSFFFYAKWWLNTNSYYLDQTPWDCKYTKRVRTQFSKDIKLLQI
jgi:hypothetical protein